MAPRKSDTTADVPTQLFQKSLETIAVAGSSAETVSRLKMTLLEKPDLSEEALEPTDMGITPSPTCRSWMIPPPP